MEGENGTTAKQGQLPNQKLFFPVRKRQSEPDHPLAIYRQKDKSEASGNDVARKTAKGLA